MVNFDQGKENLPKPRCKIKTGYDFEHGKEVLTADNCLPYQKVNRFTWLDYEERVQSFALDAEKPCRLYVEREGSNSAEMSIVFETEKPLRPDEPVDVRFSASLEFPYHGGLYSQIVFVELTFFLMDGTYISSSRIGYPAFRNIEYQFSPRTKFDWDISQDDIHFSFIKFSLPKKGTYFFELGKLEVSQ